MKEVPKKMGLFWVFAVASALFFILALLAVSGVLAGGKPQAETEYWAFLGIALACLVAASNEILMSFVNSRLGAIQDL